MSKNIQRLFIIIFVFLFFTQFTLAQLSNFNLNVAKTDETCTTNGSLSFAVSNITVGSTIVYSIYRLPDITIPISVQNAGTFGGLAAGDYRVVATQSLGDSSNSQQQDVTINNKIQKLAYDLVGTKVKCVNDGVIAVSVTSGNAVSYQIISGPVIVPVQPSNTFLNLPVGEYQIRVFDSCGEAVVQTYTLLKANISLSIGAVIIQSELPSCNTIFVKNNFLAPVGGIIVFPLTFEYTVYPPSNGIPVVLTRVITAGGMVEQEIPFYNGQSYYYNLKITDACGNVFNRNNNEVNVKFGFAADVIKLNCTDFRLSLSPDVFTAPYIIDFLTFPTAFNPVNFNSGHPGPFTTSSAIYGGIGNGFPAGSYSIQITDACGRIAVKTVVVDQIHDPVGIGSNNGCGGIISITNGIPLVSVLLVNAPSSYAVSLPENVSDHISGMQFSLLDLVEGNYTFQVTDSCGNVKLVSSTVPLYIMGNLSINQIPGCELGYGSVIVSAPYSITNAVLLAAPTSYPGVLPMDLSAKIDTGNFYFGSVPQGSYTFKFTYSCGKERTVEVVVNGYEITRNDVTITENCGSFNLLLHHVSNGNYLESYWLQKFDPVTNQWVHPYTGFVYIEGDALNLSNAISLLNNMNNLNLAYVGKFRIMKGFIAFDNAEGFNCYKDIYDFDFSGGPKITNVYAFPCLNNNDEIVVEAEGLPPLSYSITSKNGLPFVLNNGGQNSFANLESAIYNFKVQDVCGNIVNSLYDIKTLAPFTITGSIFCNGQNGWLSVPLFSFLNYEWWKENDTNAILSNSNVLNFNLYNSDTDYGTYHVRISNPSSLTSCVNTVLDYVIPPSVNNPNAGMDNSVSLCKNDGVIDLFTVLSGTYDTGGTWHEITDSGSLVDNFWDITAVPIGTYRFKYKVDGSCGVFSAANVVIVIKPIPQIPEVSVDSMICENQNLNLFALTTPNTTCQWTGPNSFSSSEQNPIISNATGVNSGSYYVKSIDGDCQSDASQIEVVVNAAPKFGLESKCVGGRYMVWAIPANHSLDVSAVSYFWTGPNGYTNSINPIDITQLASGKYSLTVTDSSGCYSSESIDVVNTFCQIPNAITPNGDNINDNFNLLGLDVQKLEIYSRWGRKVYEKENYINEWYGQNMDGGFLPDSTYYYLIRLKNEEIKLGWIFVGRG